MSASNEEIRRLNDDEIEHYVDIYANAYPVEFPHGLRGEQRQRVIDALSRGHKEDPNLNLYGFFRDNKLLGGLRFHDYQMNVYCFVIIVVISLIFLVISFI